MAALALAYYLGALVGFRLALVGGEVPAVWPPAGLAVAALVVGGRRLWPGVLLGALLAELTHGTPPIAALLVSVSAVVESLLAVELLRWSGVRSQLDRLSDLVRLTLAGAAAPAAVGAAIGVGSLAITGGLARSDVPLAAGAWWVGDALAILVVGGLGLTWLSPAAARATPIRLGEAGLAVASVAGVSWILFFDVFDLRASGESVAFPIIPLLVWVAFRVGPRGTALASLCFAAIAIAATNHGLGPFVGTSREASLVYVAVFIGLTSFTGAAVAAAIAERDDGRRALEQTGVQASAALRQLQAIEAIGRTLAERGPDPETFDAAMGLLQTAFGYSHPAIYTGDAQGVRLGAQRGYERLPGIVTDRGVIGRVMRTRQAVFLPDVSSDRDFIRASPEIVSEIVAPLLARGELLGVLNVESRDRLDERDLSSVLVVADRVAAALALAEERAKLAARAAIFQRLLDFASSISGVLGAEELYGAIAGSLDAVVPADLVGLVVLDRHSGDYVIRSEKGSSGSVGNVVRPGEGLSGLAVRDRTLVQLADYGQEAFPPAVVDHNAASRYALGLGLPLLRDGEAIGALAIARVDPDRPFTDLELEALELLAKETTLAVATAWLYGEVAELAIRDGLTGLHNRRYFDEAFTQLVAARARQPGAERAPLAAIMFDLDGFGPFNNRYGHQAGDRVLRTFADLLTKRLRGSDLAARYGGDEFVAVLPGATREDASKIADEIRLALAASRVEPAPGDPASITVSAGLAVADGPDARPEQLIGAADVGLIMAKRAGHDRVVAT